MPFPALIEAEGTLENRRKALADIFAEAGNDLDMSKVKSVDGDNAAKVAHIRSLSEEIDDLAKKAEGLRAIELAAMKSREPRSPAGEPAIPAQRGPEAKSLGELITESKAIKGKAGQVGPEAEIDIDLKTLMTTSAGWAQQSLRTGLVVPYAQRPIQITDLVPQTTTSQAAVVYMVESTSTSGAAEVAEAGTYAESAFALTETSSTVRKIGTFLPITDEQLEDVPQARNLIDNRLPFFVMQRLDQQIISGNGTAPNLRGVLNVAGIQTQARGTDPTPDAVYKAMVLVRITGRATPVAIAMHPTDLQNLKLLRTADGVYIWGNPSDVAPNRIWGMPIAETDILTAGTAVLGDWQMFSELSVRRGLNVQVSNSHSTYFVEGKQALRADIRAAFVVYRPAAFCTVTGL